MPSKKKRIWKKYKYCKKADNWDKYKASRNKVTSELRLARYQYEKGLASRIKGDNNKQFWKYGHSKTKTVTKVNRHKAQDGSLTTNDSETANVLNEFFASMFEVEGDKELPYFPLQQYTEELCTIDISEDKIKPEDHWSCIAHLMAEDMLKSAIIEEKKFKNIECK